MTAVTAASPVRRPPYRFEGYAFDLDGTVYLDDRLLPGAAETIATIRASGVAVVFVTNKPLESAEAYADKLTRLGIRAVRDDVVTALDSLIRYFVAIYFCVRLLIIAEPFVDQRSEE